MSDRYSLIEGVCRGDVPDYIPVISGWICSARHLQVLAGCSKKDFWSDPGKYTAQAYKNLDVDALSDMHIPQSEEGFNVGACSGDRGYTPEKVAEFIDNLPTPNEVIEKFDFDSEYKRYIEYFDKQQKLIAPVLWMPAQWDMLARFQWYEDFGYETYLVALLLYEDKADRLFEYSAVIGRLKAEIITKAIREHNHPKVLLTGADICTGRAPLVSPEFLRKHYWHWAKSVYEPLLDVGAYVLWHCDGNIMPIIDDILSTGIAGLQGFQKECGVNLEEVVKHKTVEGKPLIIMGAVSVADTLLNGTPEDVAQEVRYCSEVCRDAGCPLLLFTSNTIGGDVPLENIKAMYKTARCYSK